MKYGRATTDLLYMQNLICITRQISQYKRTFVQVKVSLRQSKNTIGGPEFHG